MKTISIIVSTLALAAAMIACEADKMNIGAPDVNVNGGPVDESLTPTSARARVVVSKLDGVKEVGILYGLQADHAALVTYGTALRSTERASEYLFDITGLESATRYSYVAYAVLDDGETAYSVVRGFTTIAAELTVTPSRLTLGAEASTNELVVATTFASWDVTGGGETWLSFQKNGDRLAVTTTENITDSRRVATLRFTAGSRTLNLAVTQDPPPLELSIDTLFLTAAGSGSFTVNTAASSWSVVSDASWLSVSRDGTNVNFQAAALAGVPYRVGHMIVSVGTGGMTATATVVQYATTVVAGDLAGTYTPLTVEKSRDNRGEFIGTVLTKEQYMNLTPADFEWEWDRRSEFADLDFDYAFPGDANRWCYPLFFKVYNEESPHAAGCLRVQVVAFMQLPTVNLIVSDESYYDPKYRRFVFHFELFEDYFQHTGWDTVHLTHE
jgi:hypothetical protein